MNETLNPTLRQVVVTKAPTGRRTPKQMSDKLQSLSSYHRQAIVRRVDKLKFVGHSEVCRTAPREVFVDKDRVRA